jgi:hypothetical protein
MMSCGDPPTPGLLDESGHLRLADVALPPDGQTHSDLRPALHAQFGAGFKAFKHLMPGKRRRNA